MGRPGVFPGLLRWLLLPLMVLLLASQSWGIFQDDFEAHPSP